jgi:hypothetical protein
MQAVPQVRPPRGREERNSGERTMGGWEPRKTFALGPLGTVLRRENDGGGKRSTHDLERFSASDSPPYPRAATHRTIAARTMGVGLTIESSTIDPSGKKFAFSAPLPRRRRTAQAVAPPSAGTRNIRHQLLQRLMRGVPMGSKEGRPRKFVFTYQCFERAGGRHVADVWWNGKRTMARPLKRMPTEQGR